MTDFENDMVALCDTHEIAPYCVGENESRLHSGLICRGIPQQLVAKDTKLEELKNKLAELEKHVVIVSGGQHQVTDIFENRAYLFFYHFVGPPPPPSFPSVS